MRTGRSHLRAIVNQDGAAVLDFDAGTITTLNSTGAFIWQALERDEDTLKIAHALARETGMQVETLERDVQEFIQALKHRQLLRP